MKRLLWALTALIALAAPSLAQDPLDPLGALVTRSAPVGTADPLTPAGAGVQVDPAVLRGLRTVTLFAYLRQGDTLHSAALFPEAPTKTYVLADLQRLAWELDFRLGGLHGRMSMHYDQGAKHVEGSVLFLNSESVNPPGDIAFDWLGLAVHDGLGVFATRATIPFGIEPHYFYGSTDLSTWKLSGTSHVPSTSGVPVPFVLSFGDRAYTNRLLWEPDHIRRKGSYLIPEPVLDSVEIDFARKRARTNWNRFQMDRGVHNDEGYLFGGNKNTGGAGDQKRLGKHPTMEVTHPAILSGLASDQARAEVMWVECRRKFLIDWPMVPSTDPLASYNFYGLHWISRWKAGFRRPNGSRPPWVPAWGNHHGVSGHNLEHFRSRLPALAYYTADPQLAWLTWRMGLCAYATFNETPLEEGGYYGGGFTTLRGWLRPLTTLIECGLVLESFGEAYATESRFLLDHAALKLAQLHDDHPRFARNPTRQDEMIPGHEGEPITETWQAGLGGDYVYSWYLRTGDPKALEVVKRLQEVHVVGWVGNDISNLAMPKQSLAADWTVIRAPSQMILTNWNYALLSIPGIPGIDQARRAQLANVTFERWRLQYELENRQSGRKQIGPLGKWGCSDWRAFEPMKTVAYAPWFMLN